MAASGRYARGSVPSALNLINLSSHTVSTAPGSDMALAATFLFG